MPLSVKNPPANAGDARNGGFRDRRAWWATVPGVAKRHD